MQRYECRVTEVLSYQGRSVTWFCERLGIDRSLLYRWADGTRTPSDEHRRSAAELLGVPEHYIFLPCVLPDGSDTLPEGSEKQAVTA